MLKLKLSKLLGAGLYGKVYSAVYNEEKCIAKIEKYDNDTSTASPYIRQQIFDREVASKYPKRFMVLKFSGVIPDNEVWPVDIKPWWNKEKLKYFTEKSKLKYASVLVYTPVLRYRLSDIKYKLSEDKKLSVCKYLLESLAIMNRAGYTHGDIHDDNIMCDETLSTWYLIDYGNVFHKSFTRGMTDMWWDGNTDVVGLIWDFISNPMTTYNIKFPKYRDFIKMVRKDKRYHEIKAAAPKKLLVGTDVIALITALMHYDLYIKCIGQENTDIGRHHMKYKIPNRQSYLAALEKLK